MPTQGKKHPVFRALATTPKYSRSIGTNGGSAPVEPRAALPRPHLPDQEPELMVANQALSLPCAIVWLQKKNLPRRTPPPSHPGRHRFREWNSTDPFWELSIPGDRGSTPLICFVFPKAEQHLLFRVAGSGLIGGVSLGIEENRRIRRWSFKRDGTLEIDLFDKDSQNLNVDLNQQIWSLTAELQPWIGTKMSVSLNQRKSVFWVH